MSTSKLSSSFLAAWLTYTAAVVSADMPPAKASSPDDSRTTITSQRMTVKNQENKAIFEGDVVLTKGALIVHSDHMVVTFKAADQPEGNGKVSENGREKSGAARSDLPVMSNRAVSMIEATGKLVKIIKADGHATCRKAVYDGAEDKIVLTGDPVAWQKGTRVTGQKITMYLTEDRSVVEGGSRVSIEQESGGSR